MKAGRIYRRVVIQRSVPSQDPDTGQPVMTWSNWKTKWSQRRAMKGFERFIGQQEVAHALCEYVMRDDTDTRLVTANETWRLIDGEREYDIVAVDPSDERRDAIVFRARARAEVAA